MHTLTYCATIKIYLKPVVGVKPLSRSFVVVVIWSANNC